jgi:hypothetical protein
MKKPYIKKFMDFEGFAVWIVDGDYIRNKINVNFVNYGHHYRYKFIPKNEFWIDREKVPGEMNFYLKPLLAEYKLMKKGMDPYEALLKSEAVEKRERKKKITKKEIAKLKKIKKNVNLIHRKLLKKYSGKKVKVWIVDGKSARDLFSVDFEKGGHDLYYSFIPKNEVWIDDDVEAEDIKFILIHEMHERALMSGGKEYSPSHIDANKVESHCRKNPKEANERLRFGIEENNK